MDRIQDEEQRAILLHFFANHELIAVELMALALLKFPDAPDSFRKGVLHTLQEEQNHTKWYVQRMKECGVTFGDFNLSPMIWAHISTMESPLDFVSRLSLTFEQANLDYAKHYSKVLAEVGDEKTSKILAKIYHDEIAHVGHGLKWLRRWKEKSQSDWDAWHTRLHLPLSPIRAKGMVPFNEEGRRKAGLDEEFIGELKRFQSSRGRSPDLYWFNPEVEAVSVNPGLRMPKQIEALAADLEYAFALAIPSADDLFLIRREPTVEHRERLAGQGLYFPETAKLEDLEMVRKTRKIRYERPWGVADADLLSKETGIRLRELVEDSPLPSQVCGNAEEARNFVSMHPVQKWIVKPLHSAAGRGIRTFRTDQLQVPKGKFLLEPFLEIVREFSLLYQINPPDEGGIRFVGLAYQDVTAEGQWQGSTATPRPTWDLPAEEARMIATQVLPFAKKEMPGAIEKLLKGRSHLGPLCIDSFLHRCGGDLQWHKVSEVNARWTMGRLAHQLRLKLSPTRPLTLTTRTPGDLEGCLPLGDPATASKRVPVAIIH